MIRKWKKLVFRFIQRFSSYLSSRIFETNSDTDENKHKNINNFNYSRAIQVNTEFLSHPRNVNRHFCVPDFTFITPSNLLTPSVSKSHRRKHHKRTIRFRGGKIRMSDGRRRRRRLEEWAERGEERERERREEGWRRRGKRGDGRDVSWRPTLRGKRSGLPGVPVGNGPSSPKASFTWGGRRISPTLMPPRSSTKNPLFRFLSLSFSLELGTGKES